MSLISLKAARVNAGLNQQEAADAVSISRATLNNYENNKTIPDIKTAKKLAALYKMPIDSISFFEE